MLNMKKWTGMLLALMVAWSAQAQEKVAYQIYDNKGKEVSYGKMLKRLAKQDFVFFGELHNNAVAHWLQLELTQDLLDGGADLVLGAEMLEADNQLVLSEYLQGKVSQANFKKEARLWPNYKTDYEPLVELAKAQGLPFIATNVPRRYASLVFKQGIEQLDSLSDAAKAFIAPLPITIDLNLGCYQKMLDMMGGHGGGASLNFPRSQAVKDATMAHFALQNWKKGQLFLHYNGSFHSDHHEGIVWYVKQAQPRADVMTISVVEQDEVGTLAEEHIGVADFIICVDAQLTKTH